MAISDDHKDFSDMDDDDPSSTNNNFMNQVHRKRKQSLSYSKQEAHDIDINDYDYNDFDNYTLTQQQLQPKTPSLSSQFLSQSNFIGTNHHKSSDTPLPGTSKSHKPQRRHSADKILSKPSTKNTNSADHLNRMVISLRAKIATYKEDLRIAGELGQKLFSQNAKKDDQILQYQQKVDKLKLINDELHSAKNQLLQTSELDAEHTKRLETDLHRQTISHSDQHSVFQQEVVRLKQELEHSLSDVRHLQRLNDRQRIEIETLETRNEQISQNAGETIDDLSAELAEEKDGHSNLKHKYSKLRSETTKIKINYEKRGTEIKNLNKLLQEKNQKLIMFAANKSNSSLNGGDMNENKANKQEIKLLYRQINNFKDEMEGISKHLEFCKSYLKNTVNYLETTGLLMESPLNVSNTLDVDQIYTLCKNARQFLGIDEPPPEPVYPESSPDAPLPQLPREPPSDPLPNDNNEPMIPSMPKEHTPPLDVSQIERIPMSVPTIPPINGSPLPSPPKPTNPFYEDMIASPTMPEIESKISNQPSLPPSNIPQPNVSNSPKPSLPLPPPKSPKAAKMHNLGIMPSAINISENALPAPMMPTNHTRARKNSLPTEREPKLKTISSPKQPKNMDAPSKPTQFPMPFMPNERDKEYHTKTHNLATMPAAIKNTNPFLSSPQFPTDRSDKDEVIPSLPKEVNQYKSQHFSSPNLPPNLPQAPSSKPSYITTPNLPKQPILNPPKYKISAAPSMPQSEKSQQRIVRIPSSPSSETSVPSLPSSHSHRENVVPMSKRHNLGVLPVPIDDEKPLCDIPYMPKDRTLNEKHIKIPQDRSLQRHRVKLSANAMAPPSISDAQQIVPPKPTTDSMMTNVPKPVDREVLKSERWKPEQWSLPQQENKPKLTKKKSRKKVKKKKERDSMQEQKQHLITFFTVYSDNKNWTEGGKENGVQKYILQFAEREPLNARMAFLYSMTLYLGQIVGVNKRCISHAFMLFKSVRAQIDTLSDEFALILQTLEHHNDDKLWKYVYSFLYNAAAYFKHIQRFVGTRTTVDNPRKYSRALKKANSLSRNDTMNNSISSFRKLSGLSEVSGLTEYQNRSNSNLSTMSQVSVMSNGSMISQNSNGRRVYGNSEIKRKNKSNKKKNNTSYA